MSGTFPPEKPDWLNLEVIHRGTLPPRSYFFSYDSEDDALKGNTDSACAIKLSGTWKFSHAENPFDTPPDFESVGYDTSKWSDIQVPGIWQLQGWGHPHYTNVNFPIFVDPPNVPIEHNETGCYVRTFTIPKQVRSDQFRLRFEGVDSAFHVWVNGKEVGYSQGSRNASEFDITALVDLEGENKIAVKVHKWNCATYIEDQDQWRFSGIFRDVYIHALPRDHIKDFHVQTSLDDDYRDAELQVRVEASGEGKAALRLLDSEGCIIVEVNKVIEGGKAEFKEKIINPNKWTAETPNLYKMLLHYEGRTLVQNVGFRKIEISNGLYLINGQRIVFRGANRHEHHPEHGRAVPYEFMKNDLLLMKKHNINAIRTCHQPSDPRLYALADELGLYVMDEADLECHGFSPIEEAKLTKDDQKKPFEEKKILVHRAAGRYTSDNPDWTSHYVDRARQLVMRDKNHPCVVMWSLGNEAFYGQNFQHMYDEIKSIDTSRPIHYEGDFEARSADLFSQMYPKVDDIIEFAKEPNFTKPLVLCEFVHAMGNGPGAIKEYIDAFYKYPRLQGGWIWEWANHGLKTKTKDGEDFFAYGGDYGDVPNDYNFIMDGVLFSDHTPTPGLIEYAKAIEPVQVSNLTDRNFTITNRYDIIGLEHLECQATLVADGQQVGIGEVALPADIPPHASREVALPENYDSRALRGESYLQLQFVLRKATAWAPAGHIVSTSQLPINGPEPLPRSLSSTIQPRLSQSTPSTLEIETLSTHVVMSLAAGKITSFKKFEHELLYSGMGPEITLYRALSDNDRPQDGIEWEEKLVHLAKSHVSNVSWATLSGGEIELEVTAKIAPPVFNWFLGTTTTYTFAGDGSIRIKCKGTPGGDDIPSVLPRIGVEFAIPREFQNVSWFGRGPGESYKDKKYSQHFGNWHETVHNLWVDYEFPQEGGNRTDVRWVTFESTSKSLNAFEEVRSRIEKLPILGDLVASRNTPNLSGQDTPSLTAKFGNQEGFSFNASRYTTKDVDESTHPYELHKKCQDFVIVRLDADHHGLGTGSCGPKTMEKYALKTQPFEFEIMLD